MTSNGISECLHLKAAARDIISEYFCRDSLESATAAQYADELLQAYWKEASAADVIRDARAPIPRRVLFDLLSFLCIQLSGIQTVALNMGFHIWDGLATFPCAGREHTPA